MLGLIAAVAFTGCFTSGQKVNYLEFSSVGSGDTDAEMIGATMKFVPNYEDRTIAVTYKEDSTVAADDKLIEAVFGGENFDRFEKSVEIVMDNESMEDVGVVTFSAKVEDQEKKMHYFLPAENLEETDELNAFYSDILALLTEEEQV